jgi:hypothetical protein
VRVLFIVPGKQLNRVQRISKDIVRYVSPQYRGVRDVNVSLQLPAGRYVIIPSTFDAGGVGKYWLSASATCLGVRCLLLLLCSEWSPDLLCWRDLYP